MVAWSRGYLHYSDNWIASVVKNTQSKEILSLNNDQYMDTLSPQFT